MTDRSKFNERNVNCEVKLVGGSYFLALQSANTANNKRLLQMM